MQLMVSGIAPNKVIWVVRSKLSNDPSARLCRLWGISYSQSIENARGSSKRRSPESVCYDKLLRENGPSSDRKSRKTVLIEGSVCYGKLLRDLPRGVLRRGYNLYYRHTVPVDAQRLLNRLESWRSLRTDSLAVAVRRLPSVVARIEMEIEHARAMAGLPVDATLVRPSKDDPAERPIPIALLPVASIEPDCPLTLAEAYRSYIDDPTRAWAANTREVYETSIGLRRRFMPPGKVAIRHCGDRSQICWRLKQCPRRR